ncbi:MAG: HNH endonuclease [Spiribacter salinus]|uniref:HNH endonuclease n=1 Tax=Spiribacter salinus TaxID=1335746 RepID=A0A540VAZ0_9GAMM|nr:MAG: HNH endonuclease [Spiribacter salinus]
MQRVLTLSSNRKPLMPCHPARARRLLREGRASVFRRQPFTIILNDRDDGNVQPVDCRLDPGSRTTGIALVAQGEHGDRLVWAGELTHRSAAIKQSLDSRRSLRRARRVRKTRYRKPRFDNRSRPQGWLAPSLSSRVAQTTTWVRRLTALTPVNAAQVETVRFDTQKLENPDIAGVEYQRGTLFGEELRQYLLTRHNHTCAYCRGQSNDPVLNRDHVLPKALGGTDRVANLVIACRTCNEAKDNIHPQRWIAQLSTSNRRVDRVRADNMARIWSGWRPSLKDAAAVNATRYATGNAVKTLIPDTRFDSGGRTAFNRKQQGHPKAHWVDAACVGERGSSVRISPQHQPLAIKATGWGSRQMQRVDRHGFPRTSTKGARNVQGFQTGDRVEAVVPKGRKAGRYVGRVAVRSSGSFNIQSANGVIQGINHRHCRVIHQADGYTYN